MANTKVSDLTAIVTPVNGDELHIAQSGSSLKITLLQINSFIDHGGLAGVSDDDHTIYSLADGTRDFTGKVIGVDPTADQHLATKIYVDSIVASDIGFSSSTGGLIATDVDAALRELQDEITDINSVTDHGLLSGLSDDDHNQYSLADGTRDFSGKVIGVDPTADQHLATKIYVDSIVASDIGFSSSTGGIVATDVSAALIELQDEILDISLSLSTGTLSVSGDTDLLGNVAIGSVDPVVRLHLHESSSSVNYMQFTNTTTGVGVNDGLTIGIDNTEKAVIFNREATDLYIGTSNTKRWTIPAAGGLYSEGATGGGQGVDTINVSAYYLNGNLLSAEDIVFSSATGGIVSANVGDALRELQDEITDHFSGIIVTAGDLILTSASITDTSGAISFGNANLTTTGLLGIGDVADLGVGIHVKSSDSGVISVDSNADELILENSGHVGFALLAGTSSTCQMHFGDSDNSGQGIIIYSNATDAFNFYTDATLRMNLDLGLYMNGVTGGDKGVGTINGSLYDDGTELTCYPFDAYLDGDISNEKWDNLVLGKNILDDKGKIIGIEPSIHKNMRKFKARLGGEFDPLDIDKYAAHWKTKRHLTSLPNELKFDIIQNMSTGMWIQRLVETVEIEAIHIDNLNQRLKLMENRP